MLSVVLLVVSSGVSMAAGGDHTKTSTTTHHEESGHHEEQGHEDSGHSHSEEGHSHDDESPTEWLMMIGGLFLLGTVATAPLYQYTNTQRQNFTISSVHLGVALLALFTAAVHFYLFLDHGELIMALAGLGFLGGIGLFFIGVNRQYLYSLGVLYTAVQILLWINDGMPHVESFGLIDKVVQVLLIVALGYLLLHRRRSSRH
jgi:cation transport ATPase